MVKLATVEDELKKWPEFKVEYLHAIKDWMKCQPHLPQIDDGKSSSVNYQFKRSSDTLTKHKPTQRLVVYDLNRASRPAQWIK